MCVTAVFIDRVQLHDDKVSSPESEGRASCEEHGLGFGLGFFEEAEEGVVFDADLPEDFTAVSAGHQKLQSVLIGTLGGTHKDLQHQTLMSFIADSGFQGRNSHSDPASV